LTDDGSVYHARSVQGLRRAKSIIRFDDDMPKQNFRSPEFCTHFQREVPLFLKIREFSFNTVKDRQNEAPMPTTSSIHSAVSIEHRLVTDTDRQTDRQTDRYRVIASNGASIASRG